MSVCGSSQKGSFAYECCRRINVDKKLFYLDLLVLFVKINIMSLLLAVKCKELNLLSVLFNFVK